MKLEQYTEIIKRQLFNTKTGNKLSVARLLHTSPIQVFLLNMAAILLTVVMESFMANTLGVASYGIFIYSVSWALLLGFLSNLGFSNALLRFGSIYVSSADWGHLAGIRNLSIIITLLASLAIAAIGGVTAAIIIDETKLSTAVMIALIAIPFIALIKNLSGLSRSYGGLISALMPDRILRDSLVLFFGVFIYLFALTPPTASTATACFLAASVFSLLAMIRNAYRLQPKESVQTEAKYDKYREWMTLATSLLFINIIQNQSIRVDAILVGTLTNATSAGYFNIVMLISRLVIFPLSIMNFVFAPKIAAFYARQDINGIQLIVSKATWFSISIGFVMVLPPLFFPDQFFTLFGMQNAGLNWSLTIVLVAQFFNVSMGIIIPVLTMTGYENQALMVLAAIFLVKIVLAFLIIPYFGVFGASCLAAAGILTYNAVLGFIIWRKLGIVPGLFGLKGRFSQ
jgi:O-antigen/teichoic acid export membrane protein